MKLIRATERGRAQTGRRPRRVVWRRRSSFARTPKSSLAWLGEVARRNGL